MPLLSDPSGAKEVLIFGIDANFVHFRGFKIAPAACSAEPRFSVWADICTRFLKYWHSGDADCPRNLGRNPVFGPSSLTSEHHEA